MSRGISCTQIGLKVLRDRVHKGVQKQVLAARQLVAQKSANFVAAQRQAPTSDATNSRLPLELFIQRGVESRLFVKLCCLLGLRLPKKETRLNPFGSPNPTDSLSGSSWPRDFVTSASLYFRGSAFVAVLEFVQGR